MIKRNFAHFRKTGSRKMNDKLQDLIGKIKQLENELIEEIHKKEGEFRYEIHAKKVRFKDEAKKRHKRLKEKIPRYLLEANLLNILTVPIIWFCFVPAVFMDLVVTAYQAVCFPIYRIPKVKRGDFIVIDRHSLGYLNVIEKINCVYCGYFNGLVNYVQEIAARTEQYWCPIKHARRFKTMHSRYKKFFDYGDAVQYREKIETVRRAFDDLQ